VRIDWRLLWPFRRRIYADWLFWFVLAAGAAEAVVSAGASFVVSILAAGVFWTSSFGRWWRRGTRL
jgi:hypothetical protein